MESFASAEDMEGYYRDMAFYGVAYLERTPQGWKHVAYERVRIEQEEF
jgi:hypothetical protein